MVPGALLLAAWGAAVVGAWRLRNRPLLRFHAVLGAALALACVAASRILGQLWGWLILWAWGLGALVAVATCWTAAVAVAARLKPAARRRCGGVATAAMLALFVSSVARLTFDAAYVEPNAVQGLPCRWSLGAARSRGGGG